MSGRPTRYRAAYLGSCTNQIGLNMSGNPSSVGRKGSLGRYIGSRVQSNQKYCGPVMYQGQIWKINDEPCVKKVPRGESFNSGVGHIGAPRFLCNKNCKTDTQQTKDHSPIDNGDQPHSLGILGTKLFEEEEEEAPAKTPTLHEVSLYIERPGVYRLLGDATETPPDTEFPLFSNAQLMVGGPGSHMYNWIQDLNKFIQDHKVTKVLMKLPSFEDAPVHTPDFYNFYPDQFWQLMSGQDADPKNNGGPYSFPGKPGAILPTAKYPSIIYSLYPERRCNPGNPSCNPYAYHTLAWLVCHNSYKNSDFKFLWIAPNSKVPFIGPGGSLATPPSGEKPITVIQDDVDKGHWMLNDNHNPNVAPYLPNPDGSPSTKWLDWLSDRNDDLTWDTMQMVHAVSYFAQTVVINTTDPLQTGIVWEVDKLEYQWTNEYVNGGTSTLSLEQLVTVCHEISTLLKGGVPQQFATMAYGLTPDKNWTWGLTCEAQLGELYGINNVTTVWAAWNAMKIREQELYETPSSLDPYHSIYNVEIFVAWFTNKSKGNMGNVANANQLIFQNAALKRPLTAGALLLSPEKPKPGSLLYNQTDLFVSTRTYKDGQPQAAPMDATHTVTQYPVPQVQNPMEYDLFSLTATGTMPVKIDGEHNGLNKLWAENLRITTGTTDTMAANLNATQATYSTFTGSKFVAYPPSANKTSTFTGKGFTPYDFGAGGLGAYAQALKITVGTFPFNDPAVQTAHPPAITSIVELKHGDPWWPTQSISVFASSLQTAFADSSGASGSGKKLDEILKCEVSNGNLQLTSKIAGPGFDIKLDAYPWNGHDSEDALKLFGITSPANSQTDMQNPGPPNVGETLIIKIGGPTTEYTSYKLTFDDSTPSTGGVDKMVKYLNKIIGESEPLGCPVVASNSNGNLQLTATNPGSDNWITIAADPSGTSANALALFGPGGAGKSYRGVFRTGISISKKFGSFTTKALALFGIRDAGDINSVASKYDGETFIPGYLKGTNFNGTNFPPTPEEFFTLIIDAGSLSGDDAPLHNQLKINLNGSNCTTVEQAMQAITSQINQIPKNQRDISVDILGASLGSYLKAQRVFNQAFGGDLEPIRINKPLGKSNGPLYTAMVSLAPEQFGGAPRKHATYATSNWEIQQLAADGTRGTNQEYFPDKWELPRFVPSDEAEIIGTQQQGGTALTSVGSTIFDYVEEIDSGTTGNPRINMMYFSQVYTMAAFQSVKDVIEQRDFKAIQTNISNYPFGATVTQDGNTDKKYSISEVGSNSYGSPCPTERPLALEYITTDSGTGNWYCYKTADKNYPCSYGGTLPEPSGQGTWNQNQANCDPGPLHST